jgi:glycosyltransferase involved in cell wall biosynthesis
MNIGINLMGESKFKAGTGRYAYEVLKALSEIDKRNTYFIFLPSCQESEFFFDSPRFIQLRVPAVENVIVRRVAEQMLLPFYILALKLTKGLNVVHSTNNIAPIVLLGLNTITIHDMARWKTKTNKWYKNYFLKVLLLISAKVSKKIMTVSEASCKDIITITKVSRKKIAVSLNSVNRSLFRPISDEEASKTLTANKMDITRPFIVALSSIEHRKNYCRLVRAMKRSDVSLDLYICGKKSDGYGDLIAAIKEEAIYDRIKIVHFPADDLYIALLKKAEFYVFVSIFEGAGLTPLEAMACRKAVLASDIPAVREYCGDAAFYVDPLSVESISSGIRKLSCETGLRLELEERGFRRSQKFDWKIHAEALLHLWSEEHV